MTQPESGNNNLLIRHVTYDVTCPCSKQILPKLENNTQGMFNHLIACITAYQYGLDCVTRKK